MLYLLPYGQAFVDCACRRTKASGFSERLYWVSSRRMISARGWSILADTMRNKLCTRDREASPPLHPSAFFSHFLRRIIYFVFGSKATIPIRAVSFSTKVIWCTTRVVVAKGSAGDFRPKTFLLGMWFYITLASRALTATFRAAHNTLS